MRISIFLYVAVVMSMVVPEKELFNNLFTRADKNKDAVLILFELIQTYNQGLRSFIDTKGFDVNGYMLFSGTLQTDLEKIESLVRQVRQVGQARGRMEELSNLLTANMCLYNEMRECTEYWQCFKNSGDMGDKSLYEINELMVLFNVLNDSKGIPEPDIQDYDTSVSQFMDRLQILKDNRRRLTGVAPMLNTKLAFNFARAEISLKALARQVPRFMKYMPWPESPLHVNFQI